MRELELTTANEGGRQVLTVAGEIDMESSPRLLAAIKSGLRAAPALVVDLARVRYMDSSGVAVLIQGLRAAGRRQQAFALREPSDQVVAVLELAQLLPLFGLDDEGRPA